MDIQSEKLELINWLTSLNDQSIIAKIKALLNQKVHRISREERAEIEEGKKDIEEGRHFTHEQVMENIENRFENLL